MAMIARAIFTEGEFKGQIFAAFFEDHADFHDEYSHIASAIGATGIRLSEAQQKAPPFNEEKKTKVYLGQDPYRNVYLAFRYSGRYPMPVEWEEFSSPRRAS